ncbi:hypothetical protein LK07_33005 [Streptomyces pluripotens]|uniref:Transposase IS116/IS110/IS902 C-terminal domain-containing protein n=1 Tax=Streptomyces pluripotens TaxID=1355015 RepID=A0A221P6Z9_9ACTN|nr:MULTISPECIES: transposase [Streptomyces]ARP73783.1 hypothetical protein LK06_031805 [Streptomyces pluripotens]ASN28031.1 hypothetical protein LK07_33005 [Streptomyces pluripotens]MCH0559372.1 transposase [Streptomyces sp. MUM 16J]
MHLRRLAAGRGRLPRPRLGHPYRDQAPERRSLEPNDEVAALDARIEPLVRELAPSLLERTGFGIENTTQLLVTCSDHPQRVIYGARCAKACGVAPLHASSGKAQRHRPNRGGDRQTNSALHAAVVCRLHYDEAGPGEPGTRGKRGGPVRTVRELLPEGLVEVPTRRHCPHGHDQPTLQCQET